MADERDPATDDPTPVEVTGVDDGQPPPLTTEDLDRRDSMPAWARTGLLVAVVLVIGILLGSFLVDGGDGEEGGSDDAGGSGGVASESSIPFPSGDVNRVSYWGWADLEATTIDTFDRADSPRDLGSAGTGQDWEAISGTWGIRSNVARAAGGGERPLVAVVPEGTGDGLTEVTMTTVVEGAGLVFRYLDPDNHWSITANPGVGSWTVTRTIDGDAESVGEMPAPTADGVTVSVTQNGSILRFLIDGQEYLSVTDAALGDQLQGGLIAAPATAGEAEWDRFLVMRFRDGDAAPADGS